MKIPHKSALPFADDLEADVPAPPKPVRWPLILGGSLAVFLLCLAFARSVNSDSFANHPERSIRRAALITLAVLTSALLGRALGRPSEKR